MRRLPQEEECMPQSKWLRQRRIPLSSQPIASLKRSDIIDQTELSYSQRSSVLQLPSILPFLQCPVEVYGTFPSWTKKEVWSFSCQFSDISFTLDPHWYICGIRLLMNWANMNPVVRINGGWDYGRLTHHGLEWDTYVGNDSIPESTP